MIRKTLFVAGALALLASISGSSALAQEPTNQITYFTFSAPYELPGGKVLPAGKYVFQIADSPSNRHIVQIMSEDRQTMHATLLAIPSQRQDPASEPEVRFMETAANTPPAIRTWWYPGRSTGHEFIYPKDHARRLAAQQREPVLTVATDATSTEQMQTADLSRLTPSGQETPWSADPTVAENTTAPAQSGAEPAAPMTAQSSANRNAAPGTAASSASPAPTAQSPSAQPMPERTAPAPAPERTAAAPARTALPQTASPLPLIGLLGLGSLFGAAALRFRR